MTIHSRKSYLALAAESTWGTTPGSPSYYHVPVTTYGVRMKRDRRKSRPFTGLLQAKHGKSFRGMPAGQLVTGLYGFKPGGAATSIMQLLVDWAMSEPETIDKLSKLAEWAEGPISPTCDIMDCESTAGRLKVQPTREPSRFLSI